MNRQQELFNKRTWIISEMKGIKNRYFDTEKQIQVLQDRLKQLRREDSIKYNEYMIVSEQLEGIEIEILNKEGL